MATLRGSTLAATLCAAWAAYLSDAELLALYGAPAALPPLRYLTASSNSSAATTLRAAAKAKNLYMGTAMNPGLRNTSDPLYSSTCKVPHSRIHLL